MIVEVGGAQLDDFQGRLNGGSDVVCRAAWRTDFAGWPFCATDETQPQASGSQRRRDAAGEAGTLVGFVENMKAAAVKDKLEWAIGHGRVEKVPCGEATAQIALPDFVPRFFDRKRDRKSVV